MSSSELITLTKIERRILANQERILAKLEPGESDHHERLATIYEAGYQLEYSDALGHYEEVPASICREVLDIMSMYEFLQMSYDDLSDKDGVEERDVLFPGFDGNNESDHLGYANFYCSQRRFGHLRFGSLGEHSRIEEQFEITVDLNSHFPSLEVYRRMLHPWLAFKAENPGRRWGRMTKDEIRMILDEAVYPEHRDALVE